MFFGWYMYDLSVVFGVFLYSEMIVVFICTLFMYIVQNGNTALMRAARWGHLNVIECMFTRYGGVIDINAKDKVCVVIPIYVLMYILFEFDKYLKVFVKLSLQSVEMTLYIYQYMLLSDCDYDCV